MGTNQVGTNQVGTDQVGTDQMGTDLVVSVMYCQMYSCQVASPYLAIYIKLVHTAQAVVRNLSEIIDRITEQLWGIECYGRYIIFGCRSRIQAHNIPF